MWRSSCFPSCFSDACSLQNHCLQHPHLQPLRSADRANCLQHRSRGAPTLTSSVLMCADPSPDWRGAERRGASGTYRCLAPANAALQRSSPCRPTRPHPRRSADRANSLQHRSRDASTLKSSVSMRADASPDCRGASGVYRFLAPACAAL